MDGLERTLEEGYPRLALDAKLLLRELEYVSTDTPEERKVLADVRLIAERRVSEVVKTNGPVSAREAARTISSRPGECKDLAIKDFKAVMDWMRAREPRPNTDTMRTRLLKRKQILDALLPALTSELTAAFQAVERDQLQKRYENSKTLVNQDPISEISPQNFFVTEDNYAWDLEELVQCISTNGGVMRNPLSRHLFSDADIHAILAHPLGHRLRQMREAQDQMRGEFRLATIDWIEKLGSIMLADQSNDASPSLKAIDEFLAYAATLPDDERQAVNELKVPATDQHTRQEYDYSVGESVREAKAGTTCFHKVSALLSV